MSTIAIRPYVDKSANMGLEKYQQVLFEGTSNKVPMWAREDVTGSGNVRFITGLNEFAPELNKLDPETKAAKILQIRVAVKYLESALASNEVNIKDKDFWKQVKAVRPDNTDFWKKILIVASNSEIYLDPTDPEDLIKIFSIEAGGFPEIAPSLEVAKNSQRRYKFYLDKFEETVKENTKNSIAETRSKAILLELFESNINKLRYICKSLDVNSAQYKNSTPNEVLFSNMHDFIDGIVPGVSKKNLANAEQFSKTSKLDMETLKLRAIVKDASFYGFLQVRSGQIFESLHDTPLGLTVAEVVEFLKNPLNDAVLQRVMTKVEKHWSE